MYYWKQLYVALEWNGYPFDFHKIREITSGRNTILESNLKCAIRLYYQHLAKIVWQLNILTIIGLMTREFDLSLYM